MKVTQEHIEFFEKFNKHQHPDIRILPGGTVTFCFLTSCRNCVHNNYCEKEADKYNDTIVLNYEEFDRIFYLKGAINEYNCFKL